VQIGDVSAVLVLVVVVRALVADAASLLCRPRRRR
jgi:hypothetical protein